MIKCANCGKMFTFNEDNCCENEKGEKCCEECYQNVFCYCDKGCPDILRYENAIRRIGDAYIGIYCDKCWDNIKKD
jgi:hypothetical protein